jgi:O-antigen/teichoic acid export membrane protein
MAFFGPGFEHALPALLILIGGQLVNAATGPVSVLLELSGRERTALRLSVIVTIASMPTLWVAVGLWGMEGAATVQALAVSIWTVLAVLMARKIPGIDPSIGGFLWPVRR